MNKLLFLDIDGVLNDHSRHPNGYCGIKPECVYRLNRIIAETGAKIVVSSAWRYQILGGAITTLGFEYLLRIHGLDAGPEGAARHVYGLTAKDEEIPDRGNQVWSYLHWAGRPAYVVIDDGSDEPPMPPCFRTLTESLSRHGDRWVRTDGSVGLTDADADRAIAILNRYDRPTPSAAPTPAAGPRSPGPAPPAAT